MTTGPGRRFPVPYYVHPILCPTMGLDLGVDLVFSLESMEYGVPNTQTLTTTQEAGPVAVGKTRETDWPFFFFDVAGILNS